MRPLILASTSRFRAAVLERLGVEFLTAAPDFEERDPGDLAPDALAQAFARGKAQSVPGPGLIVGADQVLEFEGRVLRKPEGLEGAADQLHELSGRSHTLHSALAVWDPERGRLEEALRSVQLTLRPLTLAQARAYVALDRPLGSVGGYTYEQRGIGLFTRVSGGDDSAILGLPLLDLVHLLELHGWDLFQAWTE
ncbi:MAG: nucleoside triphosphate pyrophosphatase [Planctomycetota bacterium]